MILNAVFYKSYIIGLFLRLSEQKVAGAQAKLILNRCTDSFPYLENEAIAKYNILFPEPTLGSDDIFSAVKRKVDEN